MYVELSNILSHGLGIQPDKATISALQEAPRAGCAKKPVMQPCVKQLARLLAEEAGFAFLDANPFVVKGHLFVSILEALRRPSNRNFSARTNGPATEGR
jgi:hypothetical protein